ncbi:MAG: DUF4266 domain-containing protein [Alphaproteobacteria bacterium]|nr:DUF4266 domain-containing protein [Alphaproteobacteria bacterium]
MRRILPLVVLVACAAGYTTVEPWQREVLARPDMASSPHPGVSAMADHAYESREAAGGAAKAGGGGCGCE